MTKRADELIVVAVIVGAHGVRGEVRVKSFTAEPEAVFAYGPLKNDTGKTLVNPVSVRTAKDHFVVTPKVSLEKEAWDGLKGTLLHVPASVLPPVDEDEFYIRDLVGLEVFAGGDVPVGTVHAVHDFGAGDILEVTLPEGGKSAMIPFTQEDVPAVDLKAGRIICATFDLWTEQTDAAEPNEDS